MWKEITEARYDEMFNVIFPALMTSVGFLMGEPMHAGANASEDRYLAFAHIGHAFYEAREPMTVAAFRLLTAAEVLACEGCGERGRHLFDCVNSDGT